MQDTSGSARNRYVYCVLRASFCVRRVEMRASCSVYEAP